MIYKLLFLKIKNYYEAKQKYPVLFNLSIPSKYKAFLDTGAVFMLPNRDEHGRKIFVFRIGKILLFLFTYGILLFNIVVKRNTVK